MFFGVFLSLLEPFSINRMESKRSNGSNLGNKARSNAWACKTICQEMIPFCKTRPKWQRKWIRDNVFELAIYDPLFNLISTSKWKCMNLVHHWSNHEKLQCISAWSSIPYIDSKFEVSFQCELYNMAPSIAHWLHTPGPLSISKCLLHRISTGWPWPLLLSIVVCLLFFQRLRVFYLCKSIVDQGLFPRPPFHWGDIAWILSVLPFVSQYRWKYFFRTLMSSWIQSWWEANAPLNLASVIRLFSSKPP